MSGRRRLGRLLSTLLRGRSARLAAAAALIAVAMAFVLQTGSQALDEVRGGVLYVGAPSVSYPSARNAGTESREYIDMASKETLFALGVTEGEVSSHAARRALASISHPPEEGAESITEEAALRAGENYLAQVGRSAWGGPDTPSEDNSEEQLASSAAERIRPELGDGRTATEESGRDEIDDGGEGGDANPSADDDSLVEGEPNAEPPQLEGGEGGQASPEYASMDPAASEPDISQAEGVESSPVVFGGEVDEEPGISDEPTGSGIEALEAPDEAPEMEFASLAVSQGEPEETAPAFPDGEGVLSEEAAPLPEPESAPEESAPEGSSPEGPTMERPSPEFVPVEPPPLQNSPEDTPEEPIPEPGSVEPPLLPSPPEESLTPPVSEPVPDEDPPSQNPPEESPTLPVVLAVAAPPSATPPEAQGDSWAVVSTVATSVEVAFGGSGPGGGHSPSPPSDPPHRPPAPHEFPAAAPHKPQPEDERPLPPAESPGDDPRSPVEPEPLEDNPAPDSEPDGGVPTQDLPPSGEPETPPDDGRPTPDPRPPNDDSSNRPEDDGVPDSGVNDPSSSRSRPSGDPSPSSAPDGGNPTEKAPASERRVASRDEVVSEGSRRVSANRSDGSSPSGAVGVPNLDRAMIRVRPSNLEGSDGYAVERILPGETVEPIYEGDVGSEEAVAIGAVAGGAPPEEMQPTPVALTDAAAELASYQSSGQIASTSHSDGAATLDAAAPSTAANPSNSADLEGAQPSSPAFVGGEAGDPIGIPESSEAPPTAVEPPVSHHQTTAPQSTPYYQEQTASDSSSTIPVSYEQTAPGQSIPAQTAPAQTVSEQSLPGQTAPAQTAPTQVAPAQTVSGQAGYDGSVALGTGVAGQAAIEPSVVEPPAPYQPAVQTVSEQQVFVPEVQPQAIQPRQTQPPAQGTPDAREVPAVSATPAAPTGAVASVSHQPTAAYTTPPAPTPESQQAVSAGQPQVVEQRVSTQPAASTNTQTNIQTNQMPIDGSIRNIASPGG